MLRLSSSECIIWFAVFLIVSVAIVTVNLLSIILFIKKPQSTLHSCHVPRYKPGRSWYVCRRIFSPFSISVPLTILMRHCENELKPGTVWDNYFSLPLVSSELSNKHCSHFIWSDACNNSSLQASPHQKVGLRGNNCWCLGFSCNVINCHFNNYTTTWRIVIWGLRMAIILLFVSICYLCFLLFHCC